MNKAYKTYFIKPESDEDEHVLLVCHGNLIRYLMLKASKNDATNWTGFDPLQCSVTTVEIKSNGRRSVMGFGEIGHVPIKSRTFL